MATPGHSHGDGFRNIVSSSREQGEEEIAGGEGKEDRGEEKRPGEGRKDHEISL